MPVTKIPYFTKLDRELREALRRYKVAVGVPEAEQIDRALREWLGERSEAWPSPKAASSHAIATNKPERKRAPTRKRP